MKKVLVVLFIILATSLVATEPKCDPFWCQHVYHGSCILDECIYP